jgi:hypothetical protein
MFGMLKLSLTSEEQAETKQPFALLRRPFKIGVLIAVKLTPSSFQPTKRHHSTIAIVKGMHL